MHSELADGRSGAQDGGYFVPLEGNAGKLRWWFCLAGGVFGLAHGKGPGAGRVALAVWPTRSILF